MVKNKPLQPQRAKTKPASSKQAASLLFQQPQDYSPDTFTGFTGLSGITTYGGPEAELPVEMQLSFKKLYKHSSVTKLKALDEIVSFTDKFDESNVDAALSCWCLSYARLITDSDIQVREKANTVLGLFLTRPLIKKTLTKHFKSLVGPWLCSLHDPRREVANSAGAAWKEIPEANRSKAVMFCKDEILSHIRDNLRQTPQTLADHKRKEDPGVAEDRYERVISSSIGALGTVMVHLTLDNNKELLSAYQGICDGTFWKFVSGKSGMIRRSVYTLVSRILETGLTDIFGANLPLLSQLIIGCFTDKDPLIHNSMWDCLLTWMKMMPSSWEHVNIRKMVLPRLFAFLRAAAYGSGPVSYPSLLPFISMLPPTVTGPDEAGRFYSEFFSALWNGISRELKNPGSSASMGVDAFAECFIYALGISQKNGSPFSEVLVNSLVSSLESLLLFESATANLSHPIVAFSDCCFRAMRMNANLASLWTCLSGLTCASLVTDREAPISVKPEVAASESGASVPKQVFIAPPGVIAERLSMFVENLRQKIPQGLLPVEIKNFIMELAGKLRHYIQTNISLPHLLLASLCSELTDEDAGFSFDDHIIPSISSVLAIQGVSAIPDVARIIKTFLNTKSSEVRSGRWNSVVLMMLAPGFPLSRATALMREICDDGPQWAHSSLGEVAIVNTKKLRSQIDEDQCKEITDFVCIMVGYRNGAQVTPIISLDDITPLATVVSSELEIASLATDSFHVSFFLDMCQALFGIKTLKCSVKSSLLYSCIPHVGLASEVYNKSCHCMQYGFTVVPMMPDFSVLEFEASLLSKIFATMESKSGYVYSISTLESVFSSLHKASCKTPEEMVPFFGRLIDFSHFLETCIKFAPVAVQYLDYANKCISPPCLDNATVLQPAQYICGSRFCIALVKALGVKIALQHSAQLLVELLVSRFTCESCPSFDWWHSEVIEFCDACLPVLQDTKVFEVALQLSMDRGGCYSLVLDQILSSLSKSRLFNAWDTFKQIVLARDPSQLQYRDASLNTLQVITSYVSVPSPETASSAFQVLENLKCTLLGELQRAQSETLIRTVESIIALTKIIPMTSTENVLQQLSEFLSSLISSKTGELSSLLFFSVLRLCCAMVSSSSPNSVLKLVSLLCISGLKYPLASTPRLGLLVPLQSCRLACRILALDKDIPRGERAVIVLSFRHDTAIVISELLAQWKLHMTSDIVLLVGDILRTLDALLGTKDFLADIHPYVDLLIDVMANGKLPELQYMAFEMVIKLLQLNLADDVVVPQAPSHVDATKAEEFEAPTPVSLPPTLRQILQLYASVPSSEFCTQLGFLLSWTAVLQAMAGAATSQKCTIASWIRQCDIFSRLLDFLFTKIEELPLADSIKYSDTAVVSLCSYLYVQGIHHLPVLVRQWAANQKRKVYHVVNEYTKSVSPCVIQREIEAAVSYHSTRSDFAVRASIVSKQVIASYEKDEVRLEITLTLPDIYPLRTVEVGSSKTVGIAEALWRKWQLSMAALLLTQDASVLDACLLWRDQLDKYFAGVEVCPICYSLFAVNGALPVLECRTCHNKFHNSCMYKWFSSSHKTTCPLCNTDFAWRT